MTVDAAAFFNDYDKLRVAVPGALTPSTTVPGAFDLPLTFQNRMTAET